MAKQLKRQDVLNIRKWASAGYSTSEIAEALGRSWQAVDDVVKGRSHQRVKEVDDLPPLPKSPAVLAEEREQLATKTMKERMRRTLAR